MSRLSLGLPLKKTLFNYRAGLDLGDAGTFARIGDRTFDDRNGIVQTVDTGVLRDNHFVMADSAALKELDEVEVTWVDFLGAAGDDVSSPITPGASTVSMDLRVRVSLADWTGSGALVGTQSTQDFLQVIGGTGVFQGQAAFASGNATVLSTVAPTVTDGDKLWVRFFMNAVTGIATFYTSTDDTNDHTVVAWTQLGATVDGGKTGTINGFGNPIFFGTVNQVGGSPLNGQVYAAGLLYDGIVVTSPDFTNVSGWNTAKTIFTDPQGNVWTVNGNAAARVVIKTTLLEGAGENLALRSEEIDNNVWAKTNVTVTANAIVAPDGETTADQLDFGTVDTDRIQQTLAIAGGTASKTFTISAWVRTSSGTESFRFNNTHGGVITNFGPDIVATTTWQRSSFTVINSADAGTGNQFIGVVNQVSGGSKTLFVWGLQMEERAFAASYNPTGATAVTRNVDSLSVAHSHIPQVSTFFLKFIEGGTAQLLDARLFHIGSSDSGANPRFMVSSFTGSKYGILHDNGIAPKLSIHTVAVTLDDLVEIRAVLFKDGSVQIGQALNGAAEVVIAASTASSLGSAWAGPLLWLNGVEGADRDGYTNLISSKVAPGVRTMDEMRVW